MEHGSFTNGLVSWTR